MISIIFGLSLASAAAAQLVNGVSMVSGYSAAATPASGSSGYGYQAPASQQTQAPSSSDSSNGFYATMPYSSYMSGGYKSLSCGYGYSKSSDGSCQAESWVRFT